MDDPLTGCGYGLPVQVLREGRWVIGWQFGAGNGAERYIFWRDEGGVPGHGWVAADRVRPDPTRKWQPVLPPTVGRRTR